MCENTPFYKITFKKSNAWFILNIVTHIIQNIYLFKGISKTNK